MSEATGPGKAAGHRLDTQQVALIGRNLLVSALLRDGLEVAIPERDRGVDLIAYVDLDESGGPFLACPIQVKAHTLQGFAVERKYERFPTLLLARLLHVLEPASLSAFCMTDPEAVQIAAEMGWTATRSWETGIYTTTSPSKRLLGLLEPHRMGPGSWLAKIRSTAVSAPVPPRELR